MWLRTVLTMSCKQSFYPSSLKDKELTVAMLQLHDTAVVDVLTQNGHCHGFILLQLLHLAVSGIFPTVVLLNLEHPGLTLLITFIFWVFLCLALFTRKHLQLDQLLVQLVGWLFEEHSILRFFLDECRPKGGERGHPHRGSILVWEVCEISSMFAMVLVIELWNI